MVLSPVKETAPARTLQRQKSVVADSSWINRGFNVLSNSNTWTSPLSKTEHRRNKLGTVRAATVAVFNVEDLENARTLSRVANATAAAPCDTRSHRAIHQALPLKGFGPSQAQAEEIAILKRQLEDERKQVQEMKDRLQKTEEEHSAAQERFTDHIQTRMREAYRLKNDLRVMVDRAQGYKDDFDRMQDLVSNLKNSLSVNERLAKEQEGVLQVEICRLATNLSDLMMLYNKSVEDHAKQRRLVEVLQKKCAELLSEKEKLEARGEALSASLGNLVHESKLCVRNLLEMHSTGRI